MNTDLQPAEIRYMTKWAAITIMVVISSMASCSAITGLDDSQEAIIEAQYELDNAEINIRKTQSRSQEQTTKTAAIENLIKSGVDPVAARCAIEGWDKNSMSDSLICQQSKLPSLE